MAFTTSSRQTPTGTLARSTTTENEISVLSSRRYRRVQVIAVTVIASGVILLLSVAITAPIVISTRGIPAQGPQDISTVITTAATSSSSPSTSSSSSTTTTKASTPTTIEDIYAWSKWSSWLPRNVTCGYKKRTRKCRSLYTKHPGTSCSGPMMQTRKLTLCRDCKEWYQSGRSKISGVYTIRPDSLHPFRVYCDMTTDGGGWTVFQRRQDGSEDFFRTWNEYKTGFGNLSGEFWLGNDKIHRLTTANESSLRVDLEDWKNNTKYAKYRRFNVASNSLNYRLNVEGYSGSAGNSLAPVHNRMAFSTKDKDNDGYSMSCALSYKGAWWYGNCLDSNLNGLYVNGSIDNPKAVTWYGFDSSFVALKFSEMKLRATSHAVL